MRARDISAEEFRKRPAVATKPWLPANFISLLACLAAAALGLGLTPGIEKSAVIWPGSGVALAVLLIFGNGVWPGILLANLLVLSALGVPATVVWPPPVPQRPARQLRSGHWDVWGLGR